MPDQHVLKRTIQRELPFNRILINGIARITNNTDYIFLECDYCCVADVCLGRSIRAIYSSRPALLARPILPIRSGLTQIGYWISLTDSTLSTKRVEHIFLKKLPQIHPLFRIIEIQKDIIEAGGRIVRISDLTKDISKKSISRMFKTKTDLTLKSFQSKITMCHAFYDVAMSEMSIKEIAYRYKFHPYSFSKSFKNRFDLYPRELRTRRDAILSWK